MKRYGNAFAWAGLAAILLALVAMWAPSAPAHAAARQRSATSDTLTLSITNGTTFPYDAFPGPRFHLVLVLANSWSGPNTTFTALITLDDKQQMSASFFGPASDNVTYTADVAGDRDSSGNLIQIGARTATATFTNPATSAPTTSNQVSFTITKLNMTMSCSMGGSVDFIWKPGQTEQVTLSAQNIDGNVPVDWTQGTAAVWFVGPTTATYSNLRPDSSGVVTVTTPSQLGWYSMNCSFSGTTYYAAQQVTTINKGVLISEMMKLGGVQLYTNPTTFTGTQSTQMYVVFKPAPGLPTPTGQFEISMGTYKLYYTSAINIGSNGTAFVTLSPISGRFDGNTIDILYFGDTHYDKQNANFPMTNPPIPSGGSAPTGGGAAPGKAATTPSATTTTTATSGGLAEGTGGGTSSVAPSTSSPSVLSSFGPFSGGGLIALLIVLGLLLVGGGAGAYVYLSRRASQPAMPMWQAPQPPEPPQPYRYDDYGNYGNYGNYGDDTAPRRRIDR